MSKKRSELIKVLGLFDLTLLLVVAVVNLNLVPVIAAAGVSVASLWVLAFFFFFLPQAIAVIELSSQFPQEGGIYLWSKIPFGELHGFLSGWCYWTNNLFYIPTLLFYLVNCALFIGGQKTLWLSNNTLFMSVAAILFLWIIVSFNVISLEFGKWVQNLGALGAFVIVVVLIAISFADLASGGSANPINISTLTPSVADWRTLSMLGVVCFAFVGLELGSIMGDEIKGAKLNIPRAVVIAGVCCVLLYATCTLALQLSIPVKDIGILSGLPQTIGQVLENRDAVSALPLLAFILSLSVVGATSAWLAGSARIPFVIGINRFLPRSFGRLHPRYNTPHKALIVEGVISTIIILLASLGATVKEVYLVLLNTAVVIQLIPFLYMFAALIKVRHRQGRFMGRTTFFKSSQLCLIAGCIGFATTAAGIILAFIPPQDAGSVSAYELKLILGCVTFLLPALFLYSKRVKIERLVLQNSKG